MFDATDQELRDYFQKYHDEDEFDWDQEYVDLLIEWHIWQNRIGEVFAPMQKAYGPGGDRISPPEEDWEAWHEVVLDFGEWEDETNFKEIDRKERKRYREWREQNDKE